MFNVDYVTMIQSIAADAAIGGPVWTMVTTFCYFAAMMFVFRAALQLRDVSEQKLPGYGAPFLTFIAAALLAALPESIATMTTAVFGTGVSTSPISYTSAQIAVSPIKAVLTIIQLIGYIFFVRGIMELRRAGEPQKFQGASVNKAIVIMASGMAAMYINYTLKVVGTVTGWNVDAILN
jgi:hypothetical protein